MSPLILLNHPSIGGVVFGLLAVAVVITAAFAFYDAITRPGAAWVYAGENRTLWVWLTLASIALPLLFGLFTITSLGVAMFYLVDKKPKLNAYQPPRRRDNQYDSWR